MKAKSTRKPSNSVPFSVKLGSFIGWAAAKTVNGAEHAVLHTKIAAQSTKRAYQLTR